MRRAFAFASLLVAVQAFADAKEAKRLQACANVVNEVMSIKEQIPRDLIEKAECVAVIPGVKEGALGFGGRFGYGAVSCRSQDGHGPWGPPLMLSLKGGSFGLQIGGQEADLVLLIMNPKGIEYLLRSKFTLGADATVTAGPVGRNAEAATDALMHAEILSYSRSRGIFAGVSLQGGTLKADTSANYGVYGEAIAPRDLLIRSARAVPRAAQAFIEALNKHSPRPGGGTA